LVNNLMNNHNLVNNLVNNHNLVNNLMNNHDLVNNQPLHTCTQHIILVCVARTNFHFFVILPFRPLDIRACLASFASVIHIR
jgi:hypothetical protein